MALGRRDADVRVDAMPQLRVGDQSLWIKFCATAECVPEYQALSCASRGAYGNEAVRPHPVCAQRCAYRQPALAGGDPLGEEGEEQQQGEPAPQCDARRGERTGRSVHQQQQTEERRGARDRAPQVPCPTAVTDLARLREVAFVRRTGPALQPADTGPVNAASHTCDIRRAKMPLPVS